MINGITLLVALIAVILGFAAFLYRAELGRVRRDNERLQRANRELLLKNSTLLDDLDDAVDAIMEANAKARHPATRARQYPITSSLASAVTRSLQLINGGA